MQVTFGTRDHSRATPKVRTPGDAETFMCDPLRTDLESKFEILHLGLCCFFCSQLSPKAVLQNLLVSGSCLIARTTSLTGRNLREEGFHLARSPSYREGPADLNHIHSWKTESDRLWGSGYLLLFIQSKTLTYEMVLPTLSVVFFPQGT